MKNKRLNTKGAIFLEGVFTTLLGIFASFLILEIYRLALVHLSMDQAAFIYTRSRGFGETPNTSREKAFNFLNDYWGSTFPYAVTFREEEGVEGWEASLHVRYPQFLKTWKDAESKHHLETTKTCRFPG